jgi:biotin carboxyl carrier protein
MSDAAVEVPSRRHMTTRQRVIFLVVGWLIVMMPFLFWWNTWFGRNLNDQQLDAYLHDQNKPRHVQHALVQIGERMARHDGTVTRWYPQLITLSTHAVDEIRNTDAWVMGQDASSAGFHEALLKMLNDPSLLVRGNAALSLVRFGDASGRPQIVALLQPANVTAAQAGTVTDTSTAGTTIHQNGVVAKLNTSGTTLEVRSPIGGRLREIKVQSGRSVAAGEVIAVVDPDSEQVWEALRALYLVGQPEDLPAIRLYERELPDISDRVRQQATATDKQISERVK